MKTFLVFISLLICQTSLGQKTLQQLLEVYNSHSVSYLSVQGLKQHMANQSPIVILDAREIKEYQISHIPGAVYVGYSDFSKEQIVQNLSNKHAPIVVYCSLGIRSEVIAERLQKMGYTNVKNLYGGIFEWKNNDYTVINQSGDTTEQVHVYSNHWGQWLLKGEKIYD